MTPSGQSICLCMIVEGAAPAVGRCLAAVKPLLDHWIVVDVGSADGTPDLVREALADLPGEVVPRAWVDFAHNRSEALALARPHADYALIVDVDDEILLPPGFAIPTLEADSYTIEIHDGGTIRRRTQLVRNALGWSYRGILHELLACADATSQGHLPIVMTIDHRGGCGRDPTACVEEAVPLEQALERETDAWVVATYTFHLAQKYRGGGAQEKALDAYLRRAGLGGSAEEIYVSLLQAGRLMQALGWPPEESLRSFRRASEVCPHRAEAAHAASRLCRDLGRNAEGCVVAAPALGLAVPSEGLLVEPWIYAYGLRDEFAVNAYWAGRYRESLDASIGALQTGAVPAAELPRLVANMRYAFDMLVARPPRRETAAAVPARSSAGDGDISTAFKRIYDEDAWSQGSGPGSSLANTIEYRAFVQRFIERNGIRTVTDLGCGDWQFSKAMDWSGVVYTGFDVVDSIVETNRARHGGENVRFETFSSIADLPGGDLLLAKEVLQHLPTRTVLAYIDEIRAKYRFALLTNTIEPKILANTDIAVGGYRPLRLDEAPFEIPGANVFGYHVHNDTFFFKNAVFLVTGEVAPPRMALARSHLIRPLPRETSGGGAPRVLIAILAKQKESVLPLYLECLERLDYPKSAIVLYIRTNDSTDRTREILRDWIGEVVGRYAGIEIDDSDVDPTMQSFDVHEWNATRFSVLAAIRNTSLAKTAEHGCDFYFTADVDNFVRPQTLRELVALDLPIVAPYLRHVNPTSMYSNYHADIDAYGYHRHTSRYDLIWSREIVGLIELPVVHCTYLIRADVLADLGYDDDSGRHEYVVFSDRARERGIPQYFDNREIYGLLTLDDDKPELIEAQKATIRGFVFGEGA